ncbi:hypothetical protein JYT90_00475, partial [bacterium AH-315-P07]|nr:hypothetical protein [bacterium AH-315-P07]
EVYDIAKDKGELKDLYTPEYPMDHLVAAGRKYVDRWSENPVLDESEMSEELLEEIEALGYMGN